MTASTEEPTFEEREAEIESTLVETVDGGDLEGAPELATYALEDNDISDYYAAGKEYRTYANDTDEPAWTDDEKKLLGIDDETLAKKAKALEEAEVEADKDDEKPAEKKGPVDARVTDSPKLSNQPPAAPTTK